MNISNTKPFVKDTKTISVIVLTFDTIDLIYLW